MVVNDKDVTVCNGITVKELLKKLNLLENKVVVEVNGNIILRDDFQKVNLYENSKIEIISFVGGG